MFCLQVLPLVAAGQTTASSVDGAWTVDTEAEAGALLIRDRDHQVVRRYPLASLDGKQTARNATVYRAAVRQSFVVALQGVAELWELSYSPAAEPIYDGYVHDYKMGEGIAKPGFLGIRRTSLAVPLFGLVFDGGYRHALGMPQHGLSHAREVQVINLDIRRQIDRVSLPATLPTGNCVDWVWREVNGRYCAP